MHPSPPSAAAGYQTLLRLLVLLTWLGGTAALPAGADDEPAGADAAKETPGEPIPLNKQGTVLLDKKNKRLLLKTHVVQQNRSLELFCCLKGSKEHESILSLDAKAYVVHTGLLALGAKPGTPVRYDPEYHPPTGQKIDLFVNWTDAEGKSQRATARSWVRQALNRFRTAKLESLPKDLTLPANSELKYDRKLKELMWYGPMTASQKDEFLALSKDKDYRRIVESFYEESQPREMKADWVFAGSGIFKDEATGANEYLAEVGDLICVSNFGSATIDIAMASTASDANLEFEAYSERIPEIGTPVTLELIPVTDEKKAPDRETEETKSDARGKDQKSKK